MSLHARQVAIAAGAVGDQIAKVAAQMVAEKTVRIDKAEEILRKIKSS
jgi:hydroxymethylglutaryl-CoA reductase